MNITQQTIAINGASAQLSLYQNGIGAAEAHLMIHASNPEAPFTEQLAAILDAYNAVLSSQLSTLSSHLSALSSQLSALTPIFARYFLSDAANQADIIQANGSLPCALSVIQQPPLDGTKVALWVYLMSDTEVRLSDNGFYEAKHSSYRHLWTGSGHNTASGSELQTLNLLNDLTLKLSSEDCTLADNCIRTWFFVNDIDNNYQGVVKARNQVFFAHGLTKNTHFIASTGIGGRQADHHVAAQLDTYSIHGISPDQIHYLYASTHLNRTSDYGVSFERGTYVDYGDRRHVFISGTASIDNKGRIMHVGDITKQTYRMLENIEALLTEAQCSWQDLAHIIVYLRDVADYALVSKLIAQRFPNTPYVIVNAPVCRPGWLIEAECMVIKPITTSFPPF